MSRCLMLTAAGLALAGCTVINRGGSERDAEEVYEAVLRHELKIPASGAGVYLEVEGHDPSPALMERMRKRWSELQPVSQMPKELAAGKWMLIYVRDVKWIDGDTAEAEGGFGNGMDAQINRHRVVRKNGEWAVEQSTIKAIS